MAIVLPDVPFLYTKPVLRRFVSTNRSGDRIMQTVEYADPVWEIPMTTAPLTEAQRLNLEAFMQDAGGGMVSVLYQPKHICVPRAYWGDPNNPAILDTGVLGSIGVSGSITITSVTAGLKLMRGDLFSLVSGAYIFMVQVIADATAGGTSISVRVGPEIPSYIAIGAGVVFKNPGLNTRVVPGTVNIPDGGRYQSSSFLLQEVPL